MCEGVGCDLDICLECVAKVAGREVRADYLFTAIPLGDGFSEAPDQSKEFMFLRTDGERLTILPTNKVLFLDASFTTGAVWPSDLKTMRETYSCETEGATLPERVAAE